MQAQNQIDQFAASLSSALSDTTTAGVAIPPSAGLPAGQNGFDLDLSSLKAGNVVHLSYTDTATNTQRSVSIIRVDNGTVLPLPNTATADPNDQVVGVDFSGSFADVVTQLNNSLGLSNLQFSATPPGTGQSLRAVNSIGFSTLTGASVTTTAPADASSLTSGSAQLSLFTSTTERPTPAQSRRPDRRSRVWRDASASTTR